MYLVIYYDEAEDKHIGSYLGMFFDNFFLLLSSRNISAACLFNWLVAFVLLKQYLKDIFLCGVIFAYIISQSPERLLLHHTGSQKDKRMKGCHFQVDLLVLSFLVGYQILGSRCMVYMSSFYTGVQKKPLSWYVPFPVAPFLQHSVSPLFEHLPPQKADFRECTNPSVPFPVLKVFHDDYRTEGLAGTQEKD